MGIFLPLHTLALPFGSSNMHKTLEKEITENLNCLSLAPVTHYVLKATCRTVHYPQLHKVISSSHFVLLLLLKPYTIEWGWASLRTHPSKKLAVQSCAAGAELTELESSSNQAASTPTLCLYLGSLQYSATPVTQPGALLAHSTKLVQHPDEAIAWPLPTGIC